MNDNVVLAVFRKLGKKVDWRGREDFTPADVVQLPCVSDQLPIVHPPANIVELKFDEPRPARRSRPWSGPNGG